MSEILGKNLKDNIPREPTGEFYILWVETCGYQWHTAEVTREKCIRQTGLTRKQIDGKFYRVVRFVTAPE